jgi:adenylate kinase family enzyme
MTPVTSPMRRVLVGGISGVGKSTLARQLGRRLDLPYVDFDALFHGPGWTPRSSFLTDVDAFITGDRWVTDSDGYQTHIGTRVHERADTLVWLDYPRWLSEWRVVRRTARRILTRERLFNGNRERFLAVLTDPEHPVRWTWSQHAARRRRTAQITADPAFRHLQVVRLRSPREAARWLASLQG